MEPGAVDVGVVVGVGVVVVVVGITGGATDDRRAILSSTATLNEARALTVMAMIAAAGALMEREKRHMSESTCKKGRREGRKEEGREGGREGR